MADIQLGAVEARFAEIIWERAPINSTELVHVCESELSWKKSTTYTVLRRLCEKGLFACADGTVTAVLSREEYYSRRSEVLVSEEYGGSLPAFVAAFTRNKKLTPDEVEEIRRMIDKYGD